MTTDNWSKEIDGIIQHNIEAIGRIFNEIITQLDCKPFDRNNMIVHLHASERLTKEICINFIGQMLMWIKFQPAIDAYYRADIIKKSKELLATIEETAENDSSIDSTVDKKK